MPDDKNAEKARAERIQDAIRRGPRAPQSPHEYVQEQMRKDRERGQKNPSKDEK